MTCDKDVTECSTIGESQPAQSPEFDIAEQVVKYLFADFTSISTVVPVAIKALRPGFNLTMFMSSLPMQDGDLHKSNSSHIEIEPVLILSDAAMLTFIIIPFAKYDWHFR